MRLRSSLVSLWLLVGPGCGPSKPSGILCASTRCGQGQVCCIDCNGAGACGTPGAVCSGTACMPVADGGSGDGGAAGTSCGAATCAVGQVCCIDCNGAGTCGAPGAVCVGASCPCGVNGGACCGTAAGACGAGLECCVGVPYPEGGVCQESCGLKSDRNLKENITPVDGDDVLARLAALPIHRWSYRGEQGVTHIGPMAQDFSAVFGLGSSERSIHPVDANGVLMLSVQALHRQLEELRRDQAALARENAALRRELAARARVR